MKTIFSTLFLVVALSPVAHAASPVLATSLRTGQYMCGGCQLVLQQTGSQILVTPGNGCGDRGRSAEYERRYSEGRQYFIAYRRGEDHPVFIRPTSSISYVFSSLGRKLLCVKI